MKIRTATKRIMLVFLTAVFLLMSIATAMLIFSGRRTSAEETYYTKDIASMPQIDFAAVGLVSDAETDTYTTTGLKEFWGPDAPGTTLDTTFTAAFMFAEGADPNYTISFRRSGWNEGLKLNLYADGKVYLYRVDADEAASRKEFKTTFAPDTWYYLQYTVANLYSDEALTQQVGYRSAVTVTDKAEYTEQFVYDFTNEEANGQAYDTGNFFLWVSNELNGKFGVASYQYEAADVPEDPVDPTEPTGYTKAIADMPKVDFAEVGLISDAETDVYTDTGLKEFWGDNAPGTAIDTTFTASFMFGSDANTGYPLSFRRSGWSEDLKLNIYADGKVELYKNRKDFKSFAGTAFTPGTWYTVEYTVANLYEDEQLSEQIGYRSVVAITDGAGYSVTYSMNFLNEEIGNGDDGYPILYNTAQFFLWVPAEIGGSVSVASIEYDPSSAPGEPEDPADPTEPTGYTKAIADMPKIDFAAVGLITDPYTEIYTGTGLKEFYEGAAPGTTLDTTFTAAIKFEEGANVNYPIGFMRSGWSDGLRLNIYADGKVYLYRRDRPDDATSRKEFSGEAFTPGTWYYVEYTVANLYSDEALQTAIGYRSTVTITDKADYNVTYSYSFTFADADNQVYDTGNFFMWIGSELTGKFGVASYLYDPNAEETEYYPAVDIDEAEVIEISDKVAMNADGFSLSSYTQEADGYYANFSQDLGNGVYEMNKTLRYRLQGSGGFHTAYAGDWIWNSYKVDFDFGKNTITFGLGGTNTEVIECSPALDTEKIYLVEVTIIEYFRADNNEKAFEMFYCRVYEDGEETPFVDWSHQYTNPIIPASGARDYLGFYMGLTGNSVRVMPADFSRDYAVTLVNGNSSNQVATSYGEPYDFSAYVQDQQGYTFAGWEYYAGGERHVIPSAGTWTVDFTTQSGGIYTGTVTAVYEPIQYKITYVIENGTNAERNPAEISVEDGTVLLEDAIPANAGEVFFGWYLNAEFTGDPVTQIECTFADITLYARISSGCTLTFIMPNGEQITVSAELGSAYDFPTQTSEGYGAISGWQRQDGDNWVDVSGPSITPEGDAVYRAVAEPIEYAITYEMDGGTNNAENPAVYTIEDSITFINPEKEGFFFVGWYIGDEQVRGIVPGSMGEVTVQARWVEDTLPETVTYTASSNAVLLPVPSGLPAGAHYNVNLYDAQDNELTVVSNSYTFETVGNYRLVYNITLPSGIYTHETQIAVEEGTDEPEPTPPDDTDPDNGGGLSGGAIAGIVIACVVVVAAGVVAAVLLTKKRKK